MSGASVVVQVRTQSTRPAKIDVVHGGGGLDVQEDTNTAGKRAGYVDLDPAHQGNIAPAQHARGLGWKGDLEIGGYREERTDHVSGSETVGRGEFLEQLTGSLEHAYRVCRFMFVERGCSSDAGKPAVSTRHVTR